ncbi:nitrate ABC transporter ATP-binding protein [bacterium]|nr:nitrate ABC transporter ATP-binding protein [bacterium]|tara:strand:- start:37569 stop:38312 length:744 start_codon:yes stop_codon:yes gene_type:complete
MKQAISINGLYKSYGNKKIFSNFNLKIPQEKIVAIFGPNGCGKSTLMSIVAGIIKSNNGSIDIDYERMSYVFQNYSESLFPWRSNYENVIFPLEIKKFSKESINGRFIEIQELFGAMFDWNEYPYNLSGGQRQILAFMRALITKPKVLLIDEAFSSLDFENNLLLREKLQQYYLFERPTILMVTHNIEEAIHLAGDIAVFPKSPVASFKLIENSEIYPRTNEFLASNKFQDIKNTVLSSFSKFITYE